MASLVPRPIPSFSMLLAEKTLGMGLGMRLAGGHGQFCAWLECMQDFQLDHAQL